MNDFAKYASSAPTAIVMVEDSSSRGHSHAAQSVVSSLGDDETLGMKSRGSGSGDAGADDNNNTAEQPAQQSRKPPELNLHNIELVGRRQEYSLLKASYKRIQRGKHPSELILIDGVSGAGKTKLANSIRDPVTLKRHGFFVSGKFEAQPREPYSALVEAFTDLCDLLQNDTDSHQDISTALKGDVSVLLKLIPNLHRVVHAARQGTSWNAGTAVEHPSNANSSSSSNGPHDQTSFTQLKAGCRKFLSAVASQKHPVVLLIDDLQWADKPSIEILKSIVTDGTSKYVLVMGTFRSDFSETSPLTDFLDSVERGKACMKCTKIHLDNFDSQQASSLIAACMCAPSSRIEEVQSLAALVVKRTGGNPFFVVRFLGMLNYYGFFEYIEDNGWEWSVDRIQSETIATENVVEILKARIETLPPNAQAVLRLAAIMGFTFDGEVLKVAYSRQHLAASMSTIQSASEEAILQKVNQALKIAEEIDLVEICENGSYRFCHDSISDCLYNMTPLGPILTATHLLLGRVMQEICSRDATKTLAYTYAIADQLNRGKGLITTDVERVDCAQCNLSAVKLAMSQCAAAVAADYARSGLEMIATLPNKWDEAGSVYSISVDLHCLAAECMYCTGKVDESNANLQQVLNNCTSLVDRTRALTIQVYSLGAQGRLEEAIDVAFKALRALGVKLPKRPGMRHAIWLIIKTKSMLQGTTDEELLASRALRYDDMKSAFDLLAIASHYSSAMMRIPHMIVTITTFLQLSVKRKCLISIPFCMFGILETAMKNIPGAVRMAELTLKIHEVQDDKIPTFGDTCVMHTFLIHWRAPLRDSLDKFYEAYSVAMEAGVFDVAFLSSNHWMQLAFSSGYPLPQLEPQMRYYCKQMEEFDHTSQTYLSFVYWQSCLNLLGQSDDPVVLTGEAMDETTYLEEAKAVMVTIAPPTLNLARILMACHFEDLQRLLILMSQAEDFGESPVGHFNIYVAKFFFALSYVQLYRRSHRRADKRKAQKSAKQLDMWSKDGCPNTKPLFALVQAELATLRQHKLSKEHIGNLFLDAIQEASAAQNDLWEAMANESAARYYGQLTRSTSSTDDHAARFYLERSLELYNRYGAYAKIEFLEKTCSHLLRSADIQPREILPND